jgi:uncharacterized RDD family membrane protein YckC
MSFENASIKRRLTCMLYESLVVFSILLIGFLVPQTILSGFGLQFQGKLLWVHIVLVLMVYFVWCWVNGGQTLPMKTWKLRIISAEPGGLRLLQAVFRYLLAWPCILLAGVGFFWALFDKDKQFLHDRLAGTRIVTKAD